MPHDDQAYDYRLACKELPRRLRAAQDEVRALAQKLRKSEWEKEQLQEALDGLARVESHQEMDRPEIKAFTIRVDTQAIRPYESRAVLIKMCAQKLVSELLK